MPGVAIAPGVARADDMSGVADAPAEADRQQVCCAVDTMVTTIALQQYLLISCMGNRPKVHLKGTTSAASAILRVGSIDALE